MALGNQLNWWESPPLLRARIRNFVIVAIICGFAAPAFVMLRDPLGIPREPWGRWGPMAFGLTPILVCWPMYVLGRRRINRQFKEAGGRLCTHCGYDLRSLGDSGACPECGHAFQADRDAEKWSNSGFSCER